MVNLYVASGEQASASVLMAQDVMEVSMSWQTLVVREEGKEPNAFREWFCYLRLAGWYSINGLLEIG